MRLRVALSVGALLAVSGGLSYLLVENAAPGAGQAVLLVNLFAAVAAVLLTLGLTARYEAGIRRIASGLAEVARGRRELRFDVSREPLVSALAHAANEAISALDTPTDPSVGPVRVRKRTGSSPDQKAVGAGDLPEVSQPAAEPVRASPTPPPVPAVSAPPADNPTIPSPPREPSVVPAAAANGHAHNGALNGSASANGSAPAQRPSSRPPPEDDDLPPLPPPPEGVSTIPPTASGNGASAPSQRPSQVPTVLPPAPMSEPAERKDPSDAQMKQEHYLSVYEAYRAAVEKVHQEDGMMTQPEFVDTLSSTEKGLVERHGCRSVRFSVLVEDGQVQLLPRLVR